MLFSLKVAYFLTVFSVYKQNFYGSITWKLEQLFMQTFQCLLFMLKWSYICYYIICMTAPLMVFPKKIVQGKLTILSIKMAHSHNYGSTLVFKFYTIKGTKRYIKNMLLALPKKIMFKAKGPFWTQKWCVLITLDLL